MPNYLKVLRGAALVGVVANNYILWTVWRYRAVYWRLHCVPWTKRVVITLREDVLILHAITRPSQKSRRGREHNPDCQQRPAPSTRFGLLSWYQSPFLDLENDLVPPRPIRREARLTDLESKSCPWV